MDRGNVWQVIGTNVAEVVRGAVMEATSEGIRVRCLTDDQQQIVCDALLQTGADLSHFASGDRVLVWRPGREGERGVVLGRIDTLAYSAAEHMANELVVEARRNLTLKCGSGSITIRADGKILIKGKDLVSHAQRLNRIKGGAVQIN